MRYLIIMLAMLALTGCVSGSMAGASDAFEVISTDVKTGNVAPIIRAGGGATSMCVQVPFEKKQQASTMFSYSRRLSLWGLFGGTQTGNLTATFICGTESDAVKLKALETFKKLIEEDK